MEVGGNLLSDRATLLDGANLFGIRIAGSAIFENSRIAGPFDLTSARIGGRATWKGAEMSDLTASGSEFSADLVLDFLKSRGTLTLSGIRVKGAVSATAASIDVLLLEGAEVDGAITLGSFLYLGGAADYALDRYPTLGRLSLAGSRVRGDVRMWSHHYRGSLDLKQVQIGGSLMIQNIEVLNGNARLDNVQIGSSLIITDTTVRGFVSAREARVGAGISIDRSNFVLRPQTDRCKTPGAAGLVIAVVWMPAIDCGETSSDLTPDNPRAVTLDLSGIRAGGSIEFSNIYSDGSANFSYLRSEGDLSIRNSWFWNPPWSERPARQAEFYDGLSMVGVRGEGDLQITDSRFDVDVFADGFSVKGSAYLHGSRFNRDLLLEAATFAGSLSLQGSEFRNIDLTRAAIQRSLALGPERLLWKEGGSLTLRNARIGDIEDRTDKPVAFDGEDSRLWLASWPNRIFFEGLIWDGPKPERGAGWYIRWLANDHDYNRQTYLTAASVFRTAGATEIATEILRAGRDRERTAAWNDVRATPIRAAFAILGVPCILVLARATRTQLPRVRLILTLIWLTVFLSWIAILPTIGWETYPLLGEVIWLTALKILVGYGVGFGPLLAILWVIAFTAIGMLVLKFDKVARCKGAVFRLGASLDRLVPVVSLGQGFPKFFEDNPLNPRIRAYFIFHSVIGYVLVGFVVAGLALIILPR